VQYSCDAIWRVALKSLLQQPCRFEEGATLFWQIVAAFRKKRQSHIYRLHKEIVIKSSIVCLKNETNVKQTTDIRHLATAFVVIAELASIAIHAQKFIHYLVMCTLFHEQEHNNFKKSNNWQ